MKIANIAPNTRRLSMMSHGRKVLFLAIACLVLTGCATTGGQDPAALKADEYKKMLDPMLGVATKADITGQFGEPLTREKVGDNEVWHYRKSFGTNWNWEIFDEFKFEFDNGGVLRKWEANVQR
jgi:hypothetical protein